ncbi:MAG: cache domain-containing protein, partial [Campylobacteraceae bacterium]|nr:cache domain-containing protein [Campylobacteraceae bacterium]
MYLKNEKTLLSLIRYALPLLVLFLSIFITTFLYFQNKAEFKQSEQSIEEKFIRDKKQTIKEQIDNIYKYIISEQTTTVENLKESLSKRVYEAHTISTNLYAQFKDTHSKDEITLMIRAALKDIRFNNKRGYFFVYDKNSTNIIHPLLPELEGKNLINYQDSKGTFLLKEGLALLKDKEELYQEWYWRKTKDNEKEFKKIGFIKNIYELDWFIGTGEYIEDFSKDVQKKVIMQIEKFRFGKNGYFIITDK